MPKGRQKIERTIEAPNTSWSKRGVEHYIHRSSCFFRGDLWKFHDKKLFQLPPWEKSYVSGSGWTAKVMQHSCSVVLNKVSEIETRYFHC